MRQFLKKLLGFKLVIVGVEYEGGIVEIGEEFEAARNEKDEPVMEKIESITIKAGRIIIDTAHCQTVYFGRTIINISYDKEWRLN